MTHRVPARVVCTLALAAIIACLHLESRGSNAGPPLDPKNPVRGLAKTAASALPITAEAQISAAVGRDQERYHGTKHSNEVRIENPGHRLTARLTPTEVQLATPAEDWRFTLTGYGYPKQLRHASRVIPHNVANRVEYQRPGMTEWYVNGPMGIEQGFTFPIPPGSRGGGPLTVQFALSGDLVAARTSDRKGLTLARRNGTPVLKYRGLTAHDSDGRELTAWLDVKDGDLSLLVDDSDARYPVVVDPFIEQVKLTASDGVSGNNFGAGVAIDGDTIVVGAPNAAVDGKVSQGAAYVFVKPAGGWSQVAGFQAKLVASDGRAGDIFGAVAVHGDVVVAGAPGNSPAVPPAGTSPINGAAYVFVKPSDGWSGTLTEQAKLVASDGAPNDKFGAAVAIDGDTIVIDAEWDDAFRGAAYVFVQPATGWSGLLTQNAKLIASDGRTGIGIGDAFGRPAIRGDTIVIGALGADSPSADCGAAYVFVKPAGGWTETVTQTAKLLASDRSTNDRFGAAVAIGQDTIAIGAPLDAHGSSLGSAYVFVKPAAGWGGTQEQQAKLVAAEPDTGSEQLGSSIAFNADTILVGALLGDVGGAANVGVVYLFNTPATGWSGTLIAVDKLVPRDGATGDQFGGSLSARGSVVVMGASGDDFGLSINQGSAYIFFDPPATLTLSPSEGTNPIESTHTVTATVTRTNGQPSEAVTVRFAVSGAVTTSGVCTTDDSGQCSFSYTGPPVPGNDTIVAFADTNANGTQESGEPGDSATKTWEANVSVDTDGDGIGDDIDTDDDNDGQTDADETACGSNPLDGNSLAVDTDGDRRPNCADPDDDNDGVADADDAFPLDAAESIDTDGDGIGNNADPDDDNDGQTDADEISCGSNPLDRTSLAPDFDGDRRPDCADPDDDNDGVDDVNDAFPRDASESLDTDGDGIGNNADPDDDNDGQTDADEISCGSNPLDRTSLAPDFDGDRRPDCADPDDDNDGVSDSIDAFPFDPSESLDTDRDGIGNNADPDDDNDGVADAIDAFPFDPMRPLRLGLTPETATNAVGTQQCVVARLTGPLDQPVPGVTIRFSVSGSIETNGSEVTGTDGRATFCYTGPILPGADVITAYADDDGDETADPIEPTASAVKSWFIPTPPVGQVTGGGQAQGATNADVIAFGFNARSTTDGFNGNCSVVDRRAKVQVKCLDVTSLTRSGSFVRFSGNATINGIETTYQIDVEDAGEPGTGVDSFRIVTMSEYSAGGVLKGGNVQVR